MYYHQKERVFYENMYDRHTVEWARIGMKSFLELREKWFEIMPDEKPDSHRSVFHLNYIYMTMCGNNLVDRYYGREEHIRKSMARDEAKDRQIADARLKSEPKCQHCSKEGLRITDKSLMHRGEDYKHGDPEEVLFMLKCTHCEKNSAFWEDDSNWERLKTKCPKCQSIMTEKSTRFKKSVKTTYTCPSCMHSYQDKLDFNSKKKVEKPDPDFAEDLSVYCLRDEKVRQEHIDAKHRLEDMAQMGRELKEKADNKLIYDAMSSLTRLKIPELTTTLSPALEEAGYGEFRLDQPNMGREVTIDFSCLDGKTDREDHDSRKMLNKTIAKALEETNWRLVSDGISYRLGYLSGRLRAYENEEDIKKLVQNKLKTKR